MKKIWFVMTAIMFFFFWGFHALSQDTTLDLLEATNIGDKARIKALLEKGADVNARDKYSDETPLFIAVWKKPNIDIVRILLDKGAEVNVRNKYDYTPLFEAVFFARFDNLGLDMVKVLLDKGAEVNVRDRYDETPLFKAVRSHYRGIYVANLDIIKALLDKGAEVNARDIGGETPLFKATRSSKPEIVRALLENGADVNVCDSIGLTPLMIAAARGNLDIAKLLLERGAEVNAKDWGKFSALSYASGDEIKNLLKDHGAVELAPPVPSDFRYWALKRPLGGAKGERTIEDFGKIIPLFPWPPPKSSAFTTIPRALLVKGKSKLKMEYVAERLASAFFQAGYGEISWYAVPGGFALASRMEQFNPDGVPTAEPQRWVPRIKPHPLLCLKDLLKALFTAQEGHYRIIAFIVTPYSFTESGKKVTPEEAMNWVHSGSHHLPDEISKLHFSDKHYCEALIYEFEQVTRNHEAVFKDPSDLQGKTHLRKAKIWSALGG
jgi:ankyrin repeat protein